ncbi:MAG: class I SAM-dependent methyltransferase [Acidobacteriota bacterium]
MKQPPSTPDDLEYVPCELCGADDTKLVFVVEGDRLVRCRRCGLIYVNPRPSASLRDQVYARDYFQKEVFKPPTHPAPSESDTSWNRQRFRLVAAGRPPGRLLDVGCGTGHFLATAKQHGWQVAGVEYSSYAAEVAREAARVDVHVGTLEDSRFPPGSFDALSLLHVLEHVPHPRRTVRRIHELLSEKGRLLIEVPDFGSPHARELRGRWSNIKPQEHLYYFTLETLRVLLQLEGFRIVTIRRTGGLGVLGAGENPAQPAAWARPLYELRRWLGPTPRLRNFLRYLYWDVLRQHDNLLIVAEKIR